MGTEISCILATAYRSSDAIDLKKLSILPHQKCWKMYVDILVSLASFQPNQSFYRYAASVNNCPNALLQILQCGGNLFDAVGAAVKAALYSTEIPKVIAATLDGGQPDIQLSDDAFDCARLDTQNYPLLVSLFKVGFSIYIFTIERALDQISRIN